MGAPLTLFFSLSLLTQVEGFSHLKIMAHFQTMVLVLRNIILVLPDQIVLAFHRQVMMGCRRCF